MADCPECGESGYTSVTPCDGCGVEHSDLTPDEKPDTGRDERALEKRREHKKAIDDREHSHIPGGSV